VLNQLADYSLPPSRWTGLFEIAWAESPGSSRLIYEGKRWLRSVKPDPAWTWVWEPLFLADRSDDELKEVALWWLRERGPRNRGAWVWTWQLLWEAGDRSAELARLGHEWLAEQVALPKPRWWIVMDHLVQARTLTNDIIEELVGMRRAALPSEPAVSEVESQRRDSRPAD
jgi:hypothetical protein